jgi:rubredoxin
MADDHPSAAHRRRGRTLVETSRIERSSDMGKWRCTICGYIYDPAKGDRENGIKPGTPWEELPDDWVCPDCGAPKSEFEQM